MARKADVHCECPHCEARLTVPARTAKTVVRCPQCKKKFHLPEAEDDREEEQDEEADTIRPEDDLLCDRERDAVEYHTSPRRIEELGKLVREYHGRNSGLFDWGSICLLFGVLHFLGWVINRANPDLFASVAVLSVIVRWLIWPVFFVGGLALWFRAYRVGPVFCIHRHGAILDTGEEERLFLWEDVVRVIDKGPLHSLDYQAVLIRPRLLIRYCSRYKPSGSSSGVMKPVHKVITLTGEESWPLGTILRELLVRVGEDKYVFVDPDESDPWKQ